MFAFSFMAETLKIFTKQEAISCAVGRIVVGAIGGTYLAVWGR